MSHTALSLNYTVHRGGLCKTIKLWVKIQSLYLKECQVSKILLPTRRSHAKRHWIMRETLWTLFNAYSLLDALLWHCDRCRTHCYYRNDKLMICTMQRLTALAINIPDFPSNSCQLVSLRWWKDHTMTGQGEALNSKAKVLTRGSPGAVAALLVVQKMPWYSPGLPGSHSISCLSYSCGGISAKDHNEKLEFLNLNFILRINKI